MRRNNTEVLSSILGRFLRDEGLEGPLNEHRLLAAWPEVMGKAIERYTSSLYIRNQILIVHLKSPALRENLMMTRETLVKRLNDFVGSQVIVNIIFK